MVCDSPHTGCLKLRVSRGLECDRGTVCWGFYRRAEPCRGQLHLGCGGMRWRDFINVDMHPFDAASHRKFATGCVADLLPDMRALGLADCYVDEIFTSHTIDHFTRWEAIDMLATGIHAQAWWDADIEVADLCVVCCRCCTPVGRSAFWLATTFTAISGIANDFETHRYVWSVPGNWSEFCAMSDFAVFP